MFIPKSFNLRIFRNFADGSYLFILQGLNSFISSSCARGEENKNRETGLQAIRSSPESQAKNSPRDQYQFYHGRQGGVASDGMTPFLQV